MTRILCIAFVFLLQCFIITALMPQLSYAADTDFVIHVEYKNGDKVSKKLSLDDIDSIDPVYPVDIVMGEDDDGNPVVATLASISVGQAIELAELGSDVKKVSYSEGDKTRNINSSDFDKVFIIYPGQTETSDAGYRLYNGSSNRWDDLKTINELKAGRSDVKAATGMSLSPSSVTMSVGDAKTIKATIKLEDYYKNNGGKYSGSIKWSSSDTKVAKVDSKGKVTATGKGSATIKAVSSSDSSISATAKITVKDNAKETTKSTKQNASSKSKSSNGYRFTTRSRWRSSYRYTTARRYTSATSSTLSDQTTADSDDEDTDLTDPEDPLDSSFDEDNDVTVGRRVTLVNSGMNPFGYETSYLDDDEFYDDEDWDDSDDSWDDEDWDDSDDNWDDDGEDGVGMGAAAGSAAAACAACGAGAVGRVRRFRNDMGISAKSSNSSGKGTKSRKEWKDPLKKIGRKK